MTSRSPTMTAPDWLPAEAKREWKRLLPVLRGANMIVSADRGGLVVMCQAWAEYVELCKVVAADGPVCTTDKGNKITSPALAARNQARDTYLRQADAFALNPYVRDRLGIVKA